MALTGKVRSSLRDFLYETHGSVKLVESSVLANQVDEDLPLSTCPFFQDVELSVLSVGSLIKFVTDLACYQCWFQVTCIASQKQASKYPSGGKALRQAFGYASRKYWRNTIGAVFFRSIQS